MIESTLTLLAIVGGLSVLVAMVYVYFVAHLEWLDELIARLERGEGLD